MPNRDTTLKDMASATGLSVAAVSMALRGKVGVSQETRERVRVAAERLGYVANPAAALLAKRRGLTGKKQGGLAVGLLAETTYADAHFRDACGKLGIEAHCFRPSQFASPEAASRILWSQGIAGLIVSDFQMPWSELERRRFEWGRFSLVKINRSLPDVPCGLVRHSAFDYMTMTLQQVVARRYRRIAVLLSPSGSELDDDARRGALLNFHACRLPPGASLVWRELKSEDFSEGEAGRQTAEWLKAEQPDVIVVFVFSFFYGLRKLGWKFPGKVGLAAVLTTDEKTAHMPIVSGCDTREPELFLRALVMLGDLIGRGERGFAAGNIQDVIEPVWIEGETLPRRPPGLPHM